MTKKHFRHHAILVTGSDVCRLEAIREEAVRLFGQDQVTLINGGLCNDGPRTFVVLPDGVEESTKTSGAFNQKRQVLTQKLKNASGLSWAEVYYGDSLGKARIVGHSSLGVAHDAYLDQTPRSLGG